MSTAGRVLLVGHYAADGQHSMLRYGDLVAELLTEAGWAVTRVRPEAPAGPPRGWRAAVESKWAGHWDKWGAFPRRLKEEVKRWSAAGPGVVVLPDHSLAPYARSLRGHRALVVCHDLMAVRGALGEIPQHRPRWSGRRLQAMIRRGLARLPHAVCVSQRTQADLERLVPSLAGHTSVVYSCLNAGYGPLPEAEARARLARWPALAAGGRFFLHVGNNSWYKNRDGLLEAYARLRESDPAVAWPPLVWAGAPLSAGQASRQAVAAWGGDLQALGSVTPAELEGLYNRATALVFPSWEEGFGWPPLEAQACGCPVVASRGGALAEVLADSAAAVAPDDLDGLAQAMRATVEKPEQAEAWRQAGRANVARFSRAVMRAGLVAAVERASAGGVVS